MPQALLPVYPSDATPINNVMSFCKRDGSIYYFHGALPVFTHTEEDLRAFRMFTSQLVVNGICKQAEIVRAFGISTISMKRYVKKLRAGGSDAFYSPHKKRQPRVLTPEVLRRAQEMLAEGQSHSAVAKDLSLKLDTLTKAVRVGRLVEAVKKTAQQARKANAM
jgi:transposase